MACQEAPGLVIEKNRLKALGGNFLGILGDQNHIFGYHMCAPPAGDYSLDGPANKAVGPYSCAIDIGMTGWPAARQWLTWLIAEIREDRIKGIAEVIGSFDGKNVRYWSDAETPDWQQSGVPYDGEGHDTWTHVAVYRSTALQDHGILAGWTANGQGNTGGGTVTTPGYEPLGYPASMLLGGAQRGVGLQTADNWGQEHFGHSPYDPPGQFTQSFRSAQLARIEAYAKQAAAATAVTLDPATITALATAVAAALPHEATAHDIAAELIAQLGAPHA